MFWILKSVTRRGSQHSAHESRLYASPLTFGIEPELLYYSSVFPTCQLAVVLGLCTRHHHLARGEDQCRGLGLTNAHDDSRESLRVVLSVPGVKSDRLEI